MEFAFTLTGKQPVLFHADDVMATDHLKAWQIDPDNKNVSVAGDDRSPPWTWQIYLYHDETNLAIPFENIMAMLRKAAARIPLPKGKGTFKELSQSSLVILEPYCEFRSHNKLVPIAPIRAMKDESFAKQFELVKKLGFELKVKRAAVGQKKHVRVRAQFQPWSVTGVIEVLDPIITPELLAQMFHIGGKNVGLLDWRPGSPKSPGPYGTFSSMVAPLAKRKSA